MEVARQEIVLLHIPQKEAYSYHAAIDIKLSCKLHEQTPILQIARQENGILQIAKWEIAMMEIAR